MQESRLEQSESNRNALLLMGLTIVLWGVSWIVMKSMTKLIGPIDLVATRYVIAFIFLFAVQCWRRIPFSMPPFWLCLGIAVMQTVGFQVLAQFALMSGGAGEVVLLAYTMPFWVVFFSWRIMGNKPGPKYLIALGFGLVGLLMVLKPWNGMGGMGSSLLALLSGACWGIGAVWSKVMFEKYQPNIINLTVWQLLMGAVITIPLGMLIPQQSWVYGPELFVGLLYMGALASGVGWLLWLSVIQRVSATVAGMSSLGVPVLAILLAWGVLGEVPDTLTKLGVVLVVTGLVVVNLPGRKKA